MGWAELLVVLLRLYEPLGLRRGIFDARAGRRSPNPTDMISKWVVLLRPVGSPGLRAGLFGLPRSAQPEPEG